MPFGRRLSFSLTTADPVETMAGAEPGDFATLSARMRGPVLTPDDAGYDAATRIWNERLAQRPRAMGRCTGAADVMAAVEFAGERGLPLAVRGGGHGYSGHGVGPGLVLDLSPIAGVRADPERRVVRVGAGATGGAVDHETQPFGLATTTATISTVGIAGYALGGGTGHLARRAGLAVDNLLSVDLVTADGARVRASEEENPELFWGIRGGGGNFGVATSFEFRLHEVGPEILAGSVVHRFEDARAVLRFYREFMATAPDEVVCYAFFLTLPPAAPFPEEFQGRTAVYLAVAYTGDPAEGEDVLRPFREFGEPILAAIDRQPYTAFQRVFDEGAPEGLRWYSRSQYLAELSDDAIETLTREMDPVRGPFTMAYLEPLGGAVGRVDPSATAFPHRDAAFSFHVLSGWSDMESDREMMQWTRDLHQAMAPHGTGGVYVNLLGEDEEDRVGAAYGPNLDRLAALKRTWDPDNLFRTNHNIRPAG